MELSTKEQDLYDFIVNKKEVTLKMIQDNLSPKHIGALGKLIRYEKIELAKSYGKYGRQDENNKVIKIFILKKEEK